MSTAFVLTGGGSLGAVQVGMLRALDEHGIRPDVLVGTSAGAVNAAYVAGPGTSAARLDSLAQLWVSMRRADVFAPEVGRWFAAATGRAPSLFPGQPLGRFLERHLGYELFEEASVPLHITATDLVTGVALVLTEGSVVTAALASAAVPGLLPPVRYQDRVWIDGAFGTLDTLAYADSCRVDDIYLLPAGYPCAGPAPRTALGISLSALGMLLHRRLIAEVSGYTGHAQLHVLPPLCPLQVSPADFTHAGSLISRAQRCTKEWLDGRLTHEAPDPQSESVLALHDHREHHEPGGLGQQAS